MADRPRVRDVIDLPGFVEQIEEINREYDFREYYFCVERGRPVSKALWKRMKKHRRSQRV